jgi:GNAT superfamily N-acetyltransferase
MLVRMTHAGPASSVTIRVATEADVSTVLQFIRDLARYEKLTDHVVASEDDLRRWLFGADVAAEVILAIQDGTPVGFALFFRNFSTFLGKPGLYLEDLFVRESARGRGIGKALLAHLASLAVERGYGRVEWAVLDWNEPAITFYRSLGATLMDDWRICRLTGGALDALAGAEPTA